MIFMKKIADKNYSDLVISRDNIYMGKVIASTHNNNVPIRKGYEDYEREYYDKVYRKILFSLNENNLVNDLLYSSPNYAVNGIESNICVNNKIKVASKIKLEKLLTYYGFSDELTREDIEKVYLMFFKNNYFLYDNHEDFGLVKTKRFGIEGYYRTNDESPFYPNLFEKLNKIISCREKPHREEKNAQKIKKLY